VSEAAIFGDGLHVIGKEGVDLEPAVRNSFRTTGFSSEIGWIKPSLGGRFVSLMKRRTRVNPPDMGDAGKIHSHTRDWRSLALVI